MSVTDISKHREFRAKPVNCPHGKDGQCYVAQVKERFFWRSLQYYGGEEGFIDLHYHDEIEAIKAAQKAWGSR